jgi:hypothetical protein
MDSLKAGFPRVMDFRNGMVESFLVPRPAGRALAA